jgi:large subunit ribosomal protein L37Ae
MVRKKKSRTSARFGARYGRKIRKSVADIEEISKRRFECPRCFSVSVKRKGTGIWKCAKCDLVFAGGAYVPRTSILRKEKEGEGEKVEEEGEERG